MPVDGKAVVAGTHAAGQDEVGGESLPSGVVVSSAAADTARPVAAIHRRDIECMATAQIEQAQELGAELFRQIAER